MIKLPRTLHIEGSRLKQGQTDPEAVEFARLSGEFLTVEEKLDGTGVSIWFDEEFTPQVWHRGSPATGKEFRQLHDWISIHQDQLFDLLEDKYVLFGEWMLHKHTIFYDRLPSYFMESDIYDRKNNLWLSTFARDSLLSSHNYIHSVPVIAAFRPERLSQLTDMIHQPLYQSDDWRENLWRRCDTMKLDLETVLKQSEQSGLSEGLYIKHEDQDQVIGRYKYVRYEFVNFIVNSGSHVMDREPVHNISLGGYEASWE
jgi:hypothetical protein